MCRSGLNVFIILNRIKTIQSYLHSRHHQPNPTLFLISVPKVKLNYLNFKLTSTNNRLWFSRFDCLYFFLQQLKMCIIKVYIITNRDSFRLSWFNIHFTRWYNPIVAYIFVYIYIRIYQYIHISTAPDSRHSTNKRKINSR